MNTSEWSLTLARCALCLNNLILRLGTFHQDPGIHLGPGIGKHSIQECHHCHVLALSTALPDATIITVAGEDTYVG